MKGTNKESGIFPLSSVTPGTASHGRRLRGSRMRRDPGPQQSRYRKVPAALSTSRKPGGKNAIPRDFVRRRATEMCQSMWKNMQEERFLSSSLGNFKRDLALWERDAVSDTLRACFWGYGPSSEGL